MRAEKNRKGKYYILISFILPTSTNVKILRHIASS